MNTAWQVKPLSRKSGASGEIFKAGATVICYVFHEEEGELVRTDILEEEVDSFEIPKNLLAKWIRKVKDEKEAESQTGFLSNVEEMFFSLYKDVDEKVRERTIRKQEVLKQLLGLILEKKRMLRRLKTKDKGIITYTHIATKKEYRVTEATLDLEEILKIQEQLGSLIY